jgi:hypothetical protein
MIIGSGTKLKDNMVPDTSILIVKKVTKPKIELISWNDTFNNTKYNNKRFGDIGK